MEYVPLNYYDTVCAFVDNYQHARQILQEICAINLELLHRREKLG